MRVLLFLALLLLGCPASKSDDGWRALADRGEAALDSGRYPEAEQHLQKAIALVEESGEQAALGPLHQTLGLVYLEQHRHALARKHLNTSLEIERPALGADHPDVIALEEALAIVDDYEQKYEAAEQRFRDILERLQRIRGPQHADVGRAMTNLAVNLGYQAKDEEAEKWYRAALPILEKTAGMDRVAHVHNGLGTTCYRRGDLECARSHLEVALSIREETLGPEHPYVATVLFNLSGVQMDEEKWADAEKSLARCVKIREARLPPDHPFLREALARYVEVLEKRGKSQQARAVKARLRP